MECYWPGKTEALRKTPVPVPILSITNPKRTGLELNPGLQGDKLATNRGPAGHVSVLNKLSRYEYSTTIIKLLLAKSVLLQSVCIQFLVAMELHKTRNIPPYITKEEQGINWMLIES